MVSVHFLRRAAQHIRNDVRQQPMTFKMQRSPCHARAVTIAVLSMFAVPVAVHGQDAGRTSKAFVEVLGNGLLISANYEQPVERRATVRFGTGGLWTEGVKYVLAFGMVGWELTEGKHVVQLSAGAGVIHFEDVFFLDGVPTTTGYGTAALAYRYQPRPRGVFFQLSFTPVLAESTLSLWAGAALGLAF
jgi:hypothetical protein